MTATLEQPPVAAMTRFTEIVSRIQYKNWHLRVDSIGIYFFLQVRFTADGADQSGRKWLLSTHMTASEIVQTAFMAVLAAEEHEAREAFTFAGVAVLGPHYNLGQLGELVRAGLLDVDARS